MSNWPITLSDVLVSGWNIREPGLVGWWNFNDVATPGRDNSGAGNTATLTNYSAIDGLSGKAISLSGASGSYVGIPITLDETKDFTLSIWHMIPSGYSWDTAGGNFIMGGWNSAKGIGFVRSLTTERWSFSFRITAGSQSVANIDSVSRDVWHHLALTYNATSKIASAYFDGVLVGTLAITLTGWAATPFTVGKYSYNGTPAYNYDTGSDDEARVYNRVLSGSEILNLYLNPSTYAALPNPVSGYGIANQDGVIRTEMDTGPAKLRTRFTATSDYLNFQLFLTRAQRQILDQFYSSLGGSINFNWTDPDTGQLLVARFKAPPSYTVEGALYYRASASLEILP